MTILGGQAAKLVVLWLGLGCLPVVAAQGVPHPRGNSSSYERETASEAIAAQAPAHYSKGLFRRAHPLAIQHGILTVDGLTVRSGINTRVADLQYLYLCVPGTGAVVVAEHPFSGAHEEPTAFRGRTLTVLAGTSRVQLTAVNRMRGNGGVYVRFDPGEMAGLRAPTLGFGDAALVPAVWSPNSAGTQAGRRRVRARVHRALRTAKLCRPSARGSERCAVIREVVYER